MPVSEAQKKDFYGKLCNRIVRAISKIIGQTAYTLAGNVKGLSASGDTVSVSEEFGPDEIDSLVSAYSRIIGPVARTLSARAASECEHVHPDSENLFCEECSKMLPKWLADSANSFSIEKKSNNRGA